MKTNWVIKLGIILLFMCVWITPILAQDLAWVKQAGGSDSDRGNGIAVDGSGNSYVTGDFEESATFGAGEAHETTLNSFGFNDIFVAKYHGSGRLLWVKQVGGSGVFDQGMGIGVDGSGASYVTGNFEGSVTFGAGEAHETTLISFGSGDIFVAKYHSNGHLLWVKQAGGSEFDAGGGIAVDSSGNSYVTGYFEESATFGAGEAHETTLISFGSRDIFVAKYHSNGHLLWAKKAGGSAFDQGNGIAVDGSGNSYVTGGFGEFAFAVVSPSATFGAGEAHETTLHSFGDEDIFVAKYHSNGRLLWVKQAGGSGGFEFGEKGVGIAVDDAGNSYVTGFFRESATFGAGEIHETTLNSFGLFDLNNIFVAKYHSSGRLLWVKQAGGPDFDAGLGIAVDGSSNSYVTGDFAESVTFGAGEVNETTLNSFGFNDIFVAKYHSNGHLLWVKQAGGLSSDAGNGIAVDSSGNSYVTGNFEESATFGAGEAHETTLNSLGELDIFVAKFKGTVCIVDSESESRGSLYPSH